MTIVDKARQFVEGGITRLGLLTRLGQAIALAPASERPNIAEVAATDMLEMAAQGFDPANDLEVIASSIVMAGEMVLGQTREDALADAAEFVALVIGNIDAAKAAAGGVNFRPEDFG